MEARTYAGLVLIAFHYEFLKVYLTAPMMCCTAQHSTAHYTSLLCAVVAVVRRATSVMQNDCSA